MTEEQVEEKNKKLTRRDKILIILGLTIIPALLGTILWEIETIILFFDDLLYRISLTFFGLISEIQVFLYEIISFLIHDLLEGVIGYFEDLRMSHLFWFITITLIRNWFTGGLIIFLILLFIILDGYG